MANDSEWEQDMGDVGQEGETYALEKRFDDEMECPPDDTTGGGLLWLMGGCGVR